MITEQSLFKPVRPLEEEEVEEEEVEEEEEEEEDEEVLFPFVPPPFPRPLPGPHIRSIVLAESGKELGRGRMGCRRRGGEEAVVQLDTTIANSNTTIAAIKKL